MKRDFKAIKWLYDELPELVSDGVLGQGAADALKLRYGEIPKRDSRTLLLTILSILGASLVGIGLIMILAHNWDGLGREVRTLVALGPLAATLCALGYFVVFKRDSRPLLVEPLCAFQTLALGAAMAIIGQTYNMGGELSTLLLFWCVAAMPLAYVLDSVMAAVLCVCVLTWHFCAAPDSFESWQAWLGLAAVVPYVVQVIVKESGSGRAALLGWFAATGATVSTFGVISQCHGRTELVAVPCLFSALYLAGTLSSGNELPAWRNPLRTAGAIGAGIMTVVMSLGACHDFSFDFGSSGSDILLYLLLAVCVAGLAALAIKRRLWDIPFGLVGPLTFATALSTANITDIDFVSGMLFSAMTLLLGTLGIVSGVRANSAGSLNGGILLVFAWIIARFFISDLDFLTKGLIFIALGIVFIVVNVVFVRRRRAIAGKEALP